MASQPSGCRDGVGTIIDLDLPTAFFDDMLTVFVKQYTTVCMNMLNGPAYLLICAAIIFERFVKNKRSISTTHVTHAYMRANRYTHTI